MPSAKFGNDFVRFLKSKSLLSNLFIVNVLMAAVVLFAAALNLAGYNFLYTWILKLFVVHADIDTLWRTPWSVLTYIFIHLGFWSLLLSLAMLYFIGILCSRYLGQKRFVGTYFIGAMVGALTFVVACNLLPNFFNKSNDAILVSAFPALLAVLFAVAVYIPDYAIYRKIKLKHIAFAFAALEAIALLGEDSAVHIASIGAGMYGVLSVYVPRKIKELQIKVKTKIKKKPADTYQSNSKRPLTDDEYNRQRAEKQKKIDAILDKISQSGYDSLTAKEKEILFKESNK